MTAEDARIQCADCGRGFLLVARVDGRDLCAQCWRARGSPFPHPPLTSAQVHAAELKAREGMLKRGGEHRYRVRAGKS